MPFVTTLATLPTTAGPAVEDALLQYFFTPQGFETVDGLRVVAPVHLADIDVANLGQFKALFSERTGERYVRDLVRLTVEAAGDVRYDDLKSRYGAMLQLVGDDAKRTTFTNWFKGFASIAEAALTSAVEQACLGAASFQTNALIAASAGTFAGTAARKAAQHVFLSELEYCASRRDRTPELQHSPGARTMNPNFTEVEADPVEHPDVCRRPRGK